MISEIEDAMGRRSYTKDEDEAILRYLLDTKRFNEVGGNAVWELMEIRAVVPERTAQSMKERFRKRIMKNLGSYELTELEKADLRRSRRT